MSLLDQFTSDENTGLDLRESAKKVAAEMGHAPDVCNVKGCDGEVVDTVDVLPLDPIDHDSTLLALCERHCEWADERNDLAREITDILRQARKEVGQEYISEIQRLSDPRGEMTEDRLQGDETAPRLQESTESMLPGDSDE
jgi:hypothetical protein